MKKSKKLLSVFLALALVITLMPAMTFTSQAKADYKVSTLAQLKSYMESDGLNCAVLQKDITGHADGDYEFWCTIKGTKWIDMNGHDIDISNDNGRYVSTLFSVPAGAHLTVYDSTKSGDSNVHYDGYINDDGSYRYRGIFSVSGDLTLTGITVEAGRSKDFYSAYYATTVWKQIFGTAVIAKNGSKIDITSCTLFGRGDNAHSTNGPGSGRNAGIEANYGSQVYFNSGEIKAKGSANCFNVYSGATVKVLSGTFTCDKLDAVKCDGKITKGTGLGKVGLIEQRIGNYATTTTQSPSNAELSTVNSLKVLPAGNGDGKFTAASGDQVQENGVTVNWLPSSDPNVSLDIFLKNSSGYYFHNVNLSTLGVDFAWTYTMKIYQNGSLLKTKVYNTTAQRTFNVNEIFDGFTPSKNVTYNLVCEFDQILNNKLHATGKTSDFYFKIVDYEKPVITSQSPTDVYYDNNNTVNMTVNATGTNLHYQWSYMKPGTNYWVPLTEETGKTMKAGPLTAADDGAQYACVVYNSKGNATSKEITLHYKPKDTGKTNPFVDVFASDYYYDAVLWAYYASPQITNGMDETHFGPNITVTRAHCVTFLWRAAGCPEPTSSYNHFVDVPAGEYYYKPVLWAVEKGITKGIADDVFAPNDTLTTQHIVTFLYRSMNPGKDGWDGEAAQWACQSYAGKPFGVDIEVNNWTDCPRRDVVVFLYRANAKG